VAAPARWGRGKTIVERRQKKSESGTQFVLFTQRIFVVRFQGKSQGGDRLRQLKKRKGVEPRGRQRINSYRRWGSHSRGEEVEVTIWGRRSQVNIPKKKRVSSYHGGIPKKKKKAEEGDSVRCHPRKKPPRHTKKKKQPNKHNKTKKTQTKKKKKHPQPKKKTKKAKNPQKKKKKKKKKTKTPKKKKTQNPKTKTKKTTQKNKKKNKKPPPKKPPKKKRKNHKEKKKKKKR